VAGIGGLALAAGILLLLGVADTKTAGGQAVLILLGFGAQFLAGYVAARVGTRARPLNGGLAALALYFVIAATSIAAGEDPAIAALVFGALIAVTMGTAAGVLVEGGHR
jgi:hypothetical protein